MHTSFWSHCQGLLRRLQRRRRARRRLPERQSWRAEALETRALLSSTPAIVADIAPGSDSSNAQAFLAIGSTTFFPGDSSIPRNLTNANGTLFFTANDRVHGAESWALNTVPASSSSLGVSGFPTTTTAGSAGSFTVTAKNADGTTNTADAGRVHFTSSDPQAVLPADYTFTAADQGMHTFFATLKTAGNRSITVTDTQTPGLVAQSNTVVKPAAASAMFVGGFPSSNTAGVAQDLVVTVTDPYGNVATGYTGTVHFTGSDPQAALPADYTFTAADQGFRTFSANLNTAGKQWIAAADTQVPSVSGVEAIIQVKPAPASVVSFDFASSSTAGVAQNLVVTLTDAYGNVATGYTGTLHFTTSDWQAALPADYTFTAADKGTHTFSVTLKTTGMHYISATDTQTLNVGVVDGTFQVEPAAVSTLMADGLPTFIESEVEGSFVVVLTDPYGNIATGYVGQVHFTSSDPQAILPPDYTFTAADQGTHMFTATFKTVGKQSVTATDIQTPALASTTADVLVWERGPIVILDPPIIHLGYPNIDGPWTRDGQHLVSIEQHDVEFIFTDETGHVSTGAFSDHQTVSGLDGMTGTIDTSLSDDGRIVWTNGQTTFTWQRVSLGGQYFNPSNDGLTSVLQVGTILDFVNRSGGIARGHLLSPTTVTIPDWNMTATFVDGSFRFTNGSSWTKLDLSAEYRNISQEPVRVLQGVSSTLIGFVNRLGETSDGNWISPTQVRAGIWNVTGTVTNGQIQWSNGTVWNKHLTVNGSSNGQGQVSILATNQVIVLTNRLGGTSTARITAPDTIVAVDWGGVVGTLAGGKILWSNNTVWDTFNGNALDAVFADITTFPFL